MTRTFSGQLGIGDHFINLAGQTSQVFAGRRNINVDHAAKLIMVNLGRSVDHLHIRHCVEVGGIQIAACMQRDLLEISDGVDLGLRVLHREHVVVAVLGIDPITGRDHAVRGQRRNHVVYRFLGRHPHPASHFAVDIELNARIVEVLRNQYVAHATELAHLRGDFGRGLVSLFLIVPADLDVNRSGQSEIDNRIHQAPGLKIVRKFRQIIRQFRSHAAHVLIAAHGVIFFEAHLNERRVLAGIAGVDRRKIRSDPDVRNDHVQVFWRNHLANVGFNTLDVLVGQFQACTGRRFDVDDKLARVSARKKAQAHHGKQARN